jgi:hypothetical protein
MKKLSFVLALLTLIPVTCLSQSETAPAASAADTALAAPIPEDQQPSKGQLMKLFEVMRIREQMQDVLKMMPQMVQQQLAEQSKQMQEKFGQNITPEQQAEMQKLIDKYMNEALNIYPVDDMIADMVPVYQRHFTKDDVDSLVGFYSTPAGQHMLALTPVIMKEYMPIVMQRMQGRTAQLQEAMINDITAQFKQSGPDAAPTAK